MGLLSSIGKAFKSVFKGIGKIFKKIGNFIGKILNSKWGKFLMIAAAVVTGGMAIVAGVQGATATAGSFFAKFVAGSKDFIAALLNPITTGKNALAGNSLSASVRAAQQGAQAGISQALASTAPSAAGSADAATSLVQNTAEIGTGGAAGVTSQAGTGGLAGNPLGGSGVPGATTASQVAAPSAGAVAPNVAKPGLLSKAADFAKSTGGGLLIGNAIQGWAQGKALEDERKYNERIERAWSDPARMAPLLEASQRSPVLTGGWLDRARRTTQDFGQQGGPAASPYRVNYMNTGG